MTFFTLVIFHERLSDERIDLKLHETQQNATEIAKV